MGGWAPAQERQRQVSSFYAIFKSLFMTLLLLYLSIWSEEGARRRRLRRDLGKEAQMGTDDSARGTAGSTVSRIMVNRVRRGASGEGKAHECLIQPHEISYKYMCRRSSLVLSDGASRPPSFTPICARPRCTSRWTGPAGGTPYTRAPPRVVPRFPFCPFNYKRRHRVFTVSP